MLRLRPLPKVRKFTPIPDDLRESLREAFAIIQESERDSDVRINFDDAIQTANLCGGRIGSPRHPFEFTYYCHVGSRPSRWFLAFHPIELEDIVDGHTTELMLYCCESPDCGHKSTDPGAHCDCDYVDDLYFGNFEFPAAEAALQNLGVSGICPNSTKGDVIAVLGEPTLSGGGQGHSTFGYIYPWIKYHRPDCQLRFEFERAKGIRSGQRA